MLQDSLFHWDWNFPANGTKSCQLGLLCAQSLALRAGQQQQTSKQKNKPHKQKTTRPPTTTTQTQTNNNNKTPQPFWLRNSQSSNTVPALDTAHVVAIISQGSHEDSGSCRSGNGGSSPFRSGFSGKDVVATVFEGLLGCCLVACCDASAISLLLCMRLFRVEGLTEEITQLKYGKIGLAVGDGCARLKVKTSNAAAHKPVNLRRDEQPEHVCHALVYSPGCLTCAVSFLSFVNVPCPAWNWRQVCDAWLQGASYSQDFEECRV